VSRNYAPGLPASKNDMILGSLVLVHYQRVIDRWTCHL